MAIKAKPGLTPWPIERVSRQVELPLSLLSSDYGSSTNRSRLYRLQWSCRCATARVAQRGGTRAEHQRNCAATRSFADVLSGCGGATSAEDCFGSECPAGSRSRDLPETKRGRGATAGTIKYPAAVRLGTGTLLRLTLLRLSTQEHVLLLTMHHIISDAWSAGCLSERWQRFTKPSPPASLCRQNSQSICGFCRVAAAVAGEELDTQLNYWKQQLNGANCAGVTNGSAAIVQTTGTKHSALSQLVPRSQISESAGRSHSIYDPAGSLQHFALPLHRSGRHPCRFPDRQPQPQ